MTVGTVTISGASSADFVVTTPPAASVAAGGSTTFSVKFDPSLAGARTASLSFGNNDSDENPYNFSIQGTGTTTASLPAPWLNQDIGAVGAAGSTTYASGTFTVRGAGTNIWDAADAFQYAYQPMTGDCTITTRVVTLGNTNTVS